MMDLVFLGGEVPSHRKLLIEAGVKHIGINPMHIDSVILYEPGFAYYYKSSAALEIAKEEFEPVAIRQKFQRFLCEAAEAKTFHPAQ
jgi:hypothetical protein